MIEVRNASLTLGGCSVLSDITLSLAERRIAIVGSNGSGKSSFARLLNGLHLPTQGDVLVDGRSTKTHGRDIRRQVGFVFQNPDNQIVFPIVAEDVAFGLKSLGLSADDRRAKAEQILRHYDLYHLRDHPSHRLSGGQKQLLAIAGVLVMNPSYVVLDEPTTLLDLRNKLTVKRAISGLEQNAIVVTHDLDLVADFDRVIVFDKGRILADDVPNAALDHYIRSMEDA
ncbi:energy-coupling factor ABC transporter ATP-binding protein [Tritonibacter horizontis]|uniref:Biotin transport ATP-binding protein BioM n=1 Tax=Tritonibacter horizontis TaxID=1768241 RepID=A0A132BUA5_9RHOB|nr:ABC transporter ATP-binding protein [Tritonibacter horizontis]KUP91941.1 biotin transport ATP-binding protein BioM [Tritonibacter horizontis]